MVPLHSAATAANNIECALPYPMYHGGYDSFAKCTHHRPFKQILIQIASPIVPVPIISRLSMKNVSRIY
jgi:hypothetical protein